MRRGRGRIGRDKAVDGLAKVEKTEVDREELLFNVDRDPRMERNVYTDHPDVVAELREELIRYFEEVQAGEKP